MAYCRVMIGFVTVRKSFTSLFIGCLWCGSVMAGDLAGEVTVEGKKRLRDIVVYLEPASRSSKVRPSKPVPVHQRGRMFSPSLLVVVRGGEVDFVNDEEREIDHNVYSLSESNKFDIGLAPKGNSRRVRFRSPLLRRSRTSS